jgi:hypothetical protein
MIKNKYVTFAIYVIAFLAMWNGIEYLLHRDTWQLVSGDGLVIPLAIAIATGYITFLRKRDF